MGINGATVLELVGTGVRLDVVSGVRMHTPCPLTSPGSVPSLPSASHVIRVITEVYFPTGQKIAKA